jgi:transposase InsO family protein
LTRHGLVQARPRRRKREDYRRWERDRSMELWQMDVMGRAFLSDGTELKVVTGLDDHSRFVVCARLVPRATATSVCRALLATLAVHGVPRQLLTDNGSVFTTRFTGGVGGALFDRICTQHGIQHLLTAPYSPTTTGKVERLHKTIRAEFLSEHDRRHDTVESLQEALDGWVAQYNTARPHQSCGNQPPAARFAFAPPATVMPLEQMVQPEGPVFTAAGAVNRKVDAKGRVALRGYDYPVGRVFTGEVVQLLVGDGLVQVFHRGVLIASCVYRGERPTRPAIPTGKPPASKKPAVPVPVGPKTRSGPTVTRHVDGNGEFGFAGRNYTAGKALAGTAVQVAVVGQQVHVSQHGALVRVHPTKHDRAKEFGAFARPNGIARKHAG